MTGAVLVRVAVAVCDGTPQGFIAQAWTLPREDAWPVKLNVPSALVVTEPLTTPEMKTVRPPGAGSFTFPETVRVCPDPWATVKLLMVGTGLVMVTWAVLDCRPQASLVVA